MQYLLKTLLITLLTAISVSLAAAPIGYSVNSDDGSEQYHDGLYRVELDTGVGTCGKEGQSVPVGVGQPTLKIDELTVGGTA